MMYWSYYPKIDLHGEYVSTAYTVVHSFLQEQLRLKHPFVVIIHGKGTGKLKEEVHQILSKEKEVLEFQLDPENLGQTIVHLNVK